MSVRQQVRFWKEAASGQGTDYAADPFVVPDTPTKNVDFICPRINDANSFAVRKAPIQKVIRGADGYNKKTQLFSSQFTVSGAFSFPLYPEHCAFWAYALTPDATTGDLPSFVADQAIEQVDGTLQYRRYLGCKLQTATIAGTSDTNMFVISGNILGKMTQTTAVTSTDFEDIVASFYPSITSYPYRFTDAGTPGYVKLNNSNQAEYNSVSISINNILDATFNESSYVSRIRFCGRDITWEDNFVLASNTYRGWFEANTQLSTANTIKLDNGTNSFTIALGSAAFVTGVNDELPFDSVHRQTVQFTNLWDGTADLTLTAS